MASIFGRRQKPTASKKEAPVSNGNQNGVEAFMAADIMENGTKGVNGSESDYHKNGRHSSTFKPQIPPTSSTNSSSSPTSHEQQENSHSNSTKG